MGTVSTLLGAVAHRQRKFGVWAMFSAVTLLVILTIGPRAEERLFPVLSDYQSINTEVDDSGALVFQALYTKRRDCDFLGRTWFGVDADGVMERSIFAVSVYPTGEGPAARPVGRNRAVKMRVMLPPGSKQLLGVFRFSCPFTPWESRVQVGPFEAWNDPSASGKSP